MIRLNMGTDVLDMDIEERGHIVRRTAFYGIIDVMNVLIYFDGENYYRIKNRYEHICHSKTHAVLEKDERNNVYGKVKWSELDFLVLDKGSKQLMQICTGTNFYLRDDIRDIYMCKNVIVTNDFLRANDIKFELED